MSMKPGYAGLDVKIAAPACAHLIILGWPAPL
jgi:hypothetical protein